MECHCIECCKDIFIGLSLNLMREATYWNSDIFCVSGVFFFVIEFPFEGQDLSCIESKKWYYQTRTNVSASDPANSRFSSLVCTFLDKKLWKFGKCCINCPFPQKINLCDIFNG